MRSQQELLEASGYASRPRDLEELLRILDSDLRLITPTDSEGKEREELPSQVLAGYKYYQLTHDYLVPSLRDWLTRKQKETRHGRAELRLAERAALWNVRPENHHLPAWWEWLNIRLCTRKQDWTVPQQQMMRKATGFHALRGATLALLLVIFTAAGIAIQRQVVEQRSADHAAALVQALLKADTAQVPDLVRELEGYRPWANDLLREELEKAEPHSPQRLHLSLALLPVDGSSQADYLCDRLLEAEPRDLQVLRQALGDAGQGPRLTQRLWAAVERPEKGRESQRLRAADALALFEPDSSRWDKAGKAVVEQLVAVNPIYLGPWLEALRPVQSQLRAPLATVFHDLNRRETERSLATNFLAEYTAQDAAALVALLLEADDKAFPVLFLQVRKHGEQALAPLNAELDRELKPTWHDLPHSGTWPEPEASLQQKIVAAHGLVEARWAFCQTLPWEDFSALNLGLRPAGYRLARLRPYVVAASGKPASGRLAAAASVLVAALWTRDGQDSHLAHGLTTAELTRRDADEQRQGFQPIDVAFYLGPNGKNGPAERFAALWIKAEPGASAKLETGLELPRLQARENTLHQQGYRRLTAAFHSGSDGQTRWAALWHKGAAQTAPDVNSAADESFLGVEPNYSGENHMGDLQVDVQLGRAGPSLSSREQFNLSWRGEYTDQHPDQGLERSLLAQGERALGGLLPPPPRLALHVLAVEFEPLPHQLAGLQRMLPAGRGGDEADGPCGARHRLLVNLRQKVVEVAEQVVERLSQPVKDDHVQGADHQPHVQVHAFGQGVTRPELQERIAVKVLGTLGPLLQDELQ
jgi:hypothetical protein